MNFVSGARKSRSDDYLVAIHRNCDGSDRTVASTGAVARRLRVSDGTASAKLRQLADSGLIVLRPYQGARLTPQGRRLVNRKLKRLRLLELFLGRVLGLAPVEATHDADRVEPAVSDRAIDRIDAVLGRPVVDHSRHPSQERQVLRPGEHPGNLVTHPSRFAPRPAD